jgi:type II secretory pathway pseudopilin PulG|tara:strand:+ start:638 stop:1222 length:585 start_codon:yes stop_codon:yes gene_type:complete
MLKFNKGAMFGLDARIALAIFGALSVISGAALYSAIQESKTIANVAKFNELAKAYEHYMLDTGSYSTKLGLFNVSPKVLVENAYSEDGWNGPYYNADVFDTSDASHNYKLKNVIKSGDTVYFKVASADASWETPEDISSGCTANCFIWIEGRLNKTETDAIDAKIDGSVTSTTGNVRSRSSGVTIYYNTGIVYK